MNDYPKRVFLTALLFCFLGLEPSTVVLGKSFYPCDRKHIVVGKTAYIKPMF